MGKLPELDIEDLLVREYDVDVSDCIIHTKPFFNLLIILKRGESAPLNTWFAYEDISFSCDMPDCKVNGLWLRVSDSGCIWKLCANHGLREGPYVMR